MTILFKEVRFIIDGWRSEVGERIHQLVNIAFLTSWRYLSLLPLSLQRVWQKPLVFDSRGKFIDSWLLLRLYPTKRSRNFFFFFSATPVPCGSFQAGDQTIATVMTCRLVPRLQQHQILNPPPLQGNFLFYILEVLLVSDEELSFFSSWF